MKNIGRSTSREIARERSARKQAEDLLKQQNNLLSKTNKELLQLNKMLQAKVAEGNNAAQFSLESPDPRIRITLDGNIMLQNPSAQQISQYIFEGKHYFASQFWKKIASLFVEKPVEWEAEVAIGEKKYSFNFQMHQSEGYCNVFGHEINGWREKRFDNKPLSVASEETVSGFIITDEKGRIEWVNKAFEKISGISLQEIKGKNPASLPQGQQTDIKSLEEQRQFYENVLNSLPADIAVFDLDHRYQFLNPVAIHNPELRKWIIGKTDAEYFEYRNKPAVFATARMLRFREAVSKKKLLSWEEDLVGDDNELQSFLRNYYPVLNKEGEVVQVIGYGIDITERKSFERKIKLSEKKYRNLINSNQALIITHDLNGIITSINPAVEKTLGYTSDDLLGKSLSALLPESSKLLFESGYLDVIKQQHEVEGIFKIYSKDGVAFYLLFKNILFKEEGTEPYVIAFAQNITTRILAEKELELARKSSIEAATAKERFLANMSHEIRTPMSGIIGIAGLLNKTLLTSKQQEYLDMITQSADNLLVIVNDVLDLEKIVSGSLVLEYIPFPLFEKVKVTMDSFRYKAEEKNIMLSLINDSPSDLNVTGDPYRLTQIINNLLSNALKFTESGSVRINIKTEKIAGKKVTATFTVQDTGIGIHEEKLADIFNPYVQERSEISRKYGGTGLGLSISKNLVEMQGGQMTVESTPGKGSTFSFFIPYEVSNVEVKKEKDSQLAIEIMQNKRVLTADDVPLNQYLIKHILSSWGCQIYIVENGEEAVRQVQEADWDLILMDIQMPVLDGMQATAQIRAMHDAKKSSIPIIALTANALHGDDEKYRNAGMTAYLTKPFSEKKLFNLMAPILVGNYKGIETEAINVEAEQQTINSDDSVLYNLDSLYEMSGDDMEFVNMMIDLFVTTTPPLLDELKDAVAGENWPLATSAIHKIKPTIESMGIDALHGIILQIESQCKHEEHTDTIAEKVNSLIESLRMCINQLNNRPEILAG